RLLQHVSQRHLRERNAFLLRQRFHPIQTFEVFIEAVGVNTYFVHRVIKGVQVVGSEAPGEKPTREARPRKDRKLGLGIPVTRRTIMLPAEGDTAGPRLLRPFGKAEVGTAESKRGQATLFSVGIRFCDSLM